ncbi:hypothetical protein [Actinoplanes sp. NPDC049316]|uniref:hypothetical protein n=1 Tax=Actinoplanes sp. NPDC049316 TaxID=3154727 RepID=UPI00341772D0
MPALASIAVDTFLKEIFTRRMKRTFVKAETATGTVWDRRYEHDAAGNILNLLDVPQTGAGEKQCFSYDKPMPFLSRLQCVGRLG